MYHNVCTNLTFSSKDVSSSSYATFSSSSWHTLNLQNGLLILLFLLFLQNSPVNPQVVTLIVPTALNKSFFYFSLSPLELLHLSLLPFKYKEERKNILRGIKKWIKMSVAINSALHHTASHCVKQLFSLRKRILLCANLTVIISFCHITAVTPVWEGFVQEYLLLQMRRLQSPTH